MAARLVQLQQHGVQVQEFEDLENDEEEEEDDDYQFSSQVKKSNNTVLNSDESNKYAKSGGLKQYQQHQVQAFELPPFENSEEQLSQKGGKHNFYMTQVIKQPASKKNVNSSAEAYNPLNMTQSS